MRRDVQEWCHTCGVLCQKWACEEEPCTPPAVPGRRNPGEGGCGHRRAGREFESVVFQECCRLLGIKKTRTTALRSQSDGLVERFNRTFIHEVAKYCSSDQRDWDVKLPSLLMAYRSAQNEATTHTPAKLMFGRELRLPVDLATGRPPQEVTDLITSNYAQMLQERLITAHRLARNSMRTAGNMKTRYNWYSREVKYNVGDNVWLHNPLRKRGLSLKLQSSWEGPYEILQVMSDVTYKIRLEPVAVLEWKRQLAGHWWMWRTLLLTRQNCVPIVGGCSLKTTEAATRVDE
ncbi:hypothetical protein C7M84_003899 [Penaeus vannamei]|uniref:Integrase catalytic domain-containing protein n=1 Tax=Penaeus vannamei TaxID=6689 RepID=A0A3R7SVN8_PENVA|nr:hypothetical protein C7M84_003899 [Penaeus vannamei]